MGLPLLVSGAHQYRMSSAQLFGGLCLSVLVGRAGVRGGSRDVALWIAGVGDGGGPGGPVGIILQLHGQVHVAHPWRLAPPAE